jgi:hypothetical protein
MNQLHNYFQLFFINLLNKKQISGHKRIQETLNFFYKQLEFIPHLLQIQQENAIIKMYIPI